MAVRKSLGRARKKRPWEFCVKAASYIFQQWNQLSPEEQKKLKDKWKSNPNSEHHWDMYFAYEGWNTVENKAKKN